MLPNREGYYNAWPLSVGVDETGPNKLATVTIQLRLFEELHRLDEGDVWTDIADEALEITGFFYLEKKDGSLNASAIESLKAAMGWDGRDPFWLQDADLSQKPVQVTLAFETYQGRDRIRVQWLNPYGREVQAGGVRRGNDDTRRTISTRLGSKLRANAGGTTQPAQKPAGRPTAPPRPAPAPAPVKRPPVKKAEGATAEQAWEVFLKHCPPDLGEEQAQSEWFKLLAAVYPGRESDSLTGEEWAAVIVEAPNHAIPF